MPQNLLDLDLAGLTAWFGELGEKPFRARQVFHWVHQAGVADFAQMTDIAKSLREKLQQQAVVTAPAINYAHVSADGTRKWLFDVGPGGGAASDQAWRNGIETVFIPEDDRGTLCVSSQVGCALECTFCSTGRQGFNRNLTVAEIIGQLWVAQHSLKTEPNRTTGEIAERPVSNVVMMGMGEPLANFENVVTALGIMLDDHAYGLSRRRVTVSTSGLVPAMDRLAQRRPVAPMGVGRHALVAVHLGAQHAALELRQHRGDAAVGLHHRGHAGVGGAQHRPAGLERAHAGDLQVLRLGQGIAVPGEVGEVQQQRGLRQRADQLGAEEVLVADVERDALATERHRRRVRRAARLVRAAWLRSASARRPG